MKCQRPYALNRVHTYWERFVFSPASIVSWGDNSDTGRFRRIQELLRRNVLLTIIFLLLPMTLIIVILALIETRSPLALVVSHIPTMIVMTTVAAGTALLTKHRLRVGDSRHCAKCDYQLPPAGPVSERCPECGALWQQPGGIRTGRRVGRPWMLYAAIGCFVIPALFFVPTLRSWNGYYLRLFPTSLLIGQVIDAPRGFTTDEWAELNKRTLSESQKLRLATGLLDARLRRGRIANDAVTWLLSQASTNSLPPDLAARFVRESVTLSLDAPKRVRSGNTFAVTLAAHRRNTPLPPGMSAMVVFGGIRTSADAEPIGRSDKYHYAMLLDKSDYGLTVRLRALGADTAAVSAGDSGGGANSDATEVRSDDAGEIHLIADVWLMFLPTTAWNGTTVTWNADGSPALPAGTTPTIRYTLDTTIALK